jgi:hypothetical protein
MWEALSSHIRAGRGTNAAGVLPRCERGMIDVCNVVGAQAPGGRRPGWLAGGEHAFGSRPVACSSHAAMPDHLVTSRKGPAYRDHSTKPIKPCSALVISELASQPINSVLGALARLCDRVWAVKLSHPHGRSGWIGYRRQSLNW